jgi:hypothetical protein
MFAVEVAVFCSHIKILNSKSVGVIPGTTSTNEEWLADIAPSIPDNVTACDSAPLSELHRHIAFTVELCNPFRDHYSVHSSTIGITADYALPPAIVFVVIKRHTSIIITTDDGIPVSNCDLNVVPLD